MKKFLTGVSILILIFCFTIGGSVSPDTAYAATAVLGDQPEVYEADEYSDNSIYLFGKDVPVSKKYQDMIDYYLQKDGWVYKGSGQCYGYAEMMRKRFGSGAGKRVNINKTVTETNMYKYLKNVKPGTHVRFEYPSGTMNHSITVYKVTKDYIYCSEGNADGGGNGIAFGAYSIGTYKGMKLQYYIEPTGSYTKSSTSIKYDSADLTGKVTLLWEPIKNAKSYTIYRSYSKTGTYKKIGTSTHPRYVDKTANYGVVYYKVKAGSYKTSPVKVYHKLKSVDVTVTHDSRGYAVLKWPKVKGASKYIIYKSKYNYGGEPKLTKLKTVKTNSYTYAYTGSYDKDLLVRPVYSKNSKCNGFGTYVWGPKRVAPKAKVASVKKVEGSTPDYYGRVEYQVGVKTPYVNKKGTYLYIRVYRSTEKNGDYEWIDDVYLYDTRYSEGPKIGTYTAKKVYYITDYLVPGSGTYYYKAVAFNNIGAGTVSDAKTFTPKEE